MSDQVSDTPRTRSHWPGSGAALSTDVDEDATADHAYVEAHGWGGPNIWFIRVLEGT